MYYYGGNKEYIFELLPSSWYAHDDQAAMLDHVSSVQSIPVPKANAIQSLSENKMQTAK